MIKKEAPTIDLVIKALSNHLHSRDFQIERVLSGVSTYVYRVQLGADTYYLRILPEQNMSFAMEVHVHSLLRKQQVQVPEVVFFENDTESLGMSLMLVKEILGSPIEDFPPLVGYEDILCKAGQQLAVLNRIQVDGFGSIKRGKEVCGNILKGEHHSLQEYIYAFFDEDLYLLSENVFHRDVAIQIKNTINTGLALMIRHPSCLNHGDFDDSHIFYHNGNFTGIIDFGEMQGNSPFYDLGHFKLHDGQHGQLAAGYPSLAEGYNKVRSLTNDDRIEIDLWALWIGVRRLGMVHKRTWGRYHDFLLKSVTFQMDRLYKSL
ncbi:phosphotransferase family protein [Paenibacillus luteus]|uniref:phosphotransferase family protein n=1 Tax=Paenibacillus luteus TaxID=2545753 RepID=UPI0013757C42|nr:aminoglycoside phosphotransferase family protein [Paenibacillus luteus]